jgi:predicted enzyme related to lactoylglutathione lyase
MHRSRLCGFIIDCQVEDLDAAARFWSAALGRELEPASPSDPGYRGIKMRPDEPVVMVQRVEHESRVHLDIEADDVEAEVERLEKLGARRIAKVKTWWVLEAPSGQRFCVVRPQRGPLGDDANEWT